MSVAAKKRGSGLLLTVLTLAAFASVSVLLVRVYLSIGRTSGNVSSADRALTMADQGIEEGLLRYDAYTRTNIGLNACKEFGLGEIIDGTCATPTSNSVSLMPLRRGYMSNTVCSTIASDIVDPSLFVSKGQDPNCPYYDLAVRNRVLLTSAQTEYTEPTQAFDTNSNSFSQNISWLGPSSSTYTAKLQASTAPSGSPPNESYSASCGANCTVFPTLVSANSTSILTSTDRKVLLVLNSVKASNIFLKVLWSSNDILIDKGFTTVESTGYAGGIIQKKLLNIYDHSNSLTSWPNITKYERETTQTYGPQGCFQFVNTSSTCTAQ